MEKVAGDKLSHACLYYSWTKLLLIITSLNFFVKIKVADKIKKIYLIMLKKVTTFNLSKFNIWTYNVLFTKLLNISLIKICEMYGLDNMKINIATQLA